MAGDITKVNLIPVWVVYKSTNLGLTQAGDVTVTYTPQWREYKAHQTGAYRLDDWAIGGELTVQLTISELADKVDWEVIFALGEEQQAVADRRFSFTKIADVTTNSQFIGNVRASTYAGKLEFIPVADYTSDTTETDNNFVIPKAYVRENGDFLFSFERALEIPVTFHALFVPNATEGEALAWVGKTTGAWTAV